MRKPEEALRKQWLDWLHGANEFLKPHGIDYEDVLLLTIVDEIATRTIFPSQKHLVRELHLNKVEISRSLARLEQKGFITRRWRKWGDRRKKHAYATNEGAEFLTNCECHFASLRRALYIEPFLD